MKISVKAGAFYVECKAVEKNNLWTVSCTTHVGSMSVTTLSSTDRKLRDAASDMQDKLMQL